MERATDFQMPNSLAWQVNQAVERLAIPLSDNLDIIPYDSATVAVVQLEISQYPKVSDFVEHMHQIVADAVNHRAHLVCFPALTAWLALPFSSRFSRIIPELTEHLSTGQINPHRISDMLSACSAEMMEVYITTMSQLAKQHGIYIMAGTALYYEMHQAYHRAFLFDNFGAKAGIQDKIVPSFLEQIFDVTPAGEIGLFETPFGNISLLLTSDTMAFEPMRIAKNLGASFVICPDLHIGTPTPMDLADGINLRVMENIIYGVQPTLVGNTGLGFSLGKGAAVYAPPDISFAPGTVSTLYKTGTTKGTRLLMASLNVEALNDPKILPYLDKNPEFIEENYHYF